MPKLSEKGAIQFIVLIILLIGIAGGVFLATRKEPFKIFPKAKEILKSFIKDEETDLASRGYIIQLKNPSEAENAQIQTGGSFSGISRPQVAEYKNTLQDEHKKAKNDILSRLGKRNFRGSFDSADKDSVTILQEYTTSFNGLALNITKEEAERVKQSPYVKDVYPNLVVQANLMDSVSLINADKVWQKEDSLGQNITGKGATIAVIDTGIDYIHPGLGATQIIDRNFETTSTKSTYINEIAMAGNKFVYSGDHSVYFVSLDTGEAQEILALSPKSWTGRVATDGRYIAYYGYWIDWGTSSETITAESALYLYDTQTSMHKKISDTRGLGSVFVQDGKVIYGRNAKTEGFDYDYYGPYIYIYDIATGTETSLDVPEFKDIFETIMFRLSGNMIAAFIPPGSSRYPRKHIIYNLDTKEKRDLTPVDTGAILDFKGTKILYNAMPSPIPSAYTWDVYYLYDINTEESIKLRYKPSSLSSALDFKPGKLGNLITETTNEGEKISDQAFNLYTFFSYPMFGGIGENVVYYSQNLEAGKLIGYDLNQQRNVEVNLLKRAREVSNQNDKVCFSVYPFMPRVYCHTYDPQSQYSLPDSVFNSKVVGGFNFIEGTNDPRDDQGHGTHVAGTIAGNGVLKGVAPDAKLVAYKVLDRSGRGLFSDIIAALEKTLQTHLDGDSSNDIHAVNMSLGAKCPFPYTAICGPDDPLSQAVDNTVNAGISVVVAAGNNGPSASTVATPGTARKAITVGAVDKEKKIADFSSRGPVVTETETINKPDIVAPGVGICASRWDLWRPEEKCFDENNVSLNGTSMAAPHVAGIVALLKQVDPSWTPVDIKTSLKTTAVNIGYDVNTQGAGFVDALAAISLPSPTPTPTPTPNPDLLVNNISVLGTPRVGRSNSLNVAVENKGDMEAKSDKGISIGVTITKPDGTSLGTCSTVINRSLKLQDKITVQIRNCPKYTVSGSHQITATIDSTKSISESNEDNNSLTTPNIVSR